MQLYISSYPNVGPLHCAAAVEWHEDGEGTSTRRHQPSTFSRLLYWIYPTGGRRFLCKMPVDNVHPQRFAPSIGNFEKDTYMWVFNCLGRPGRFGNTEKNSAILLNSRFLRERGMASNPKMEYQVFLWIFQKNSAMATLSLKEMGN